MEKSRAIPQKCVATLDKHVGPVYSVKYNADGNYCMSAGEDRTIKLWNPTKQKLIHSFSGGHNREVFDIAMYVDV